MNHAQGAYHVGYYFYEVSSPAAATLIVIAHTSNNDIESLVSRRLLCTESRSGCFGLVLTLGFSK